MVKRRKTLQTPDEIFNARISNLERKIKDLENQKTLTAPGYDSANFPVNSVPNQIALADSTGSGGGGGGGSSSFGPYIDITSAVSLSTGSFGTGSHVYCTVDGDTVIPSTYDPIGLMIYLKLGEDGDVGDGYPYALGGIPGIAFWLAGSFMIGGFVYSASSALWATAYLDGDGGVQIDPTSAFSGYGAGDPTDVFFSGSGIYYYKAD